MFIFSKMKGVLLQEPSESVGAPDLPDNATADGAEKKDALERVVWSCFQCIVLGLIFCFFQMADFPQMISDNCW